MLIVKTNSETFVSVWLGSTHHQTGTAAFRIPLLKETKDNRARKSRRPKRSCHTFYVTSSFSHKIANSYPDSYNYDAGIHKFSKNKEAS